MASKNCTLCGELKPLSDFYKRKDRKHGRASACSKCELKKTRERRLKNKNWSLYIVWQSMKQRCLNKNSTGYVNYGGRGISVCGEWLNNSSEFINWALLNGWKEGLTIDREDNDGNYNPKNCRFVTQLINNHNRRKLKSLQDYIGVRKHRRKWVAKIRVNRIAVHIGMYSNQIDAAVAYDSYSISHGLKRRLNFNNQLTVIK